MTAGLLGAVDAQAVVDATGVGAMYALMALGVGLVFGVLRLVNFAYGQIVMAGAYALGFASQPTPHLWDEPLPTWLAVVLCLGVVLVLSVAMELTVFRPLRRAAPAVMLVATFAVAFFLQAVALLVDLEDDGLIGEPAIASASLNDVVSVAGVDIRKVTILAAALAVGGGALLALFFARTNLGLQMRAAAADFQTARLLGVRANRVIGAAVVFSGLIAGVVAILLTVQNPLVGPQFGLDATIIVLVGVVLGGLDRLWTATLGGFTVGFAYGIIGAALPTEHSVYLPSVLFAMVIVVLLLRPAGLFVWGGRAVAAERL